MTNLCGHERDVLILALRAGEFHPYNWADAHDAVYDPAKLTTIIVELMQERGTRASINGREIDDAVLTHWPNEHYPNHEPGIRIRSGLHSSRNFGKELTMPQARAFALRIIDAPAVTDADGMIWILHAIA